MRGGMGQVIEVESSKGLPFELLAAFDRIEHPARGRDGGKDGAAGVLQLKSGTRLKGKGFQTIPAGDRLVLMTPGGGGVGSPTERPTDALAKDRRDGLVTAAD
jgi:N-methylhydantoinase B